MRRHEHQLRDAATHVCYELQQLADTPLADTYLAEQPDDRRLNTLAVACLESGLLHARNLLEFLDEKTNKRITASDFMGKPWSPSQSDAIDRLRGVKGLLNTSLSHLSWERLVGVDDEGNNPTWTMHGLGCDVVAVLAELLVDLRKADRTEVAGWFIPNLWIATQSLGIDWPSADLPQPDPGQLASRPRIDRRRA